MPANAVVVTEREPRAIMLGEENDNGGLRAGDGSTHMSVPMEV